MAVKEVYLYDDTNNPLRIAGITLELFDSSTGVRLDSQTSKNRNPALGTSSIDWGADLTFTPGSHPVEIFINDPTYRYPGNTVESLNGQTTDRIDIDLLKLPVTPLSSGTSLPTLVSLLSAVKKERRWTEKEKKAVINFINNYIKLVAKNTLDSPELPKDVSELLTNWNESLDKLGIDPGLLRPEVPEPLAVM